VAERECEMPLKDHLCRGPLYRVTDNGHRRYLCMGAIKRLIRENHEIEIGENVPRKFKNEEPDIFIMDPPLKRKSIFKDIEDKKNRSRS